MSDELLIITKRRPESWLGGSRSGRKARKDFAIRHYSKAKTTLLVVPAEYFEDGDMATFYQSSTGFALKLSADGDRKVSQKKNSRTIHIPIEVTDRVSVADGTTPVVVEHRADRIWFFPFDQFATK